jgi:hypothetical protein
MRSIQSMTVCAVAVSLLALSGIATAQAEDKPRLSADIKKVLDAEGPEAALARFKKLYPAQKEKYNVDLESFGKLAKAYAEAGDMEKMAAVFQMTTQLSQDAVSAAMAQSGIGMPEQPEPEPEPEQPEPEPAPAHDAGPARDDLDRFVGLYSDPADPKKTRALFATVSCDGYLVVGATWGDAANWWMKSVGDTTFEYADSFTQLKIEFEVGADGKAAAMNHDLKGLPSPMKHIAPLPDDWKDCVKRPLR